MRIQNLLLLSVLVSLTATVFEANAQSAQLPPQPFTAADACRTFYFATQAPTANPTDPNNILTANRFCYSSTQIMSASVPGFCAIQKHLGLTTSNECTSVSSNTVADQEALVAVKRVQQQAESARVLAANTAANAAATANVTGTTTTGTTTGTTTASGSSGMNAAQTLQMMQILAAYNSNNRDSDRDADRGSSDRSARSNETSGNGSNTNNNSNNNSRGSASVESGTAVDSDSLSGLVKNKLKKQTDSNDNLTTQDNESTTVRGEGGGQNNEQPNPQAVQREALDLCNRWKFNTTTNEFDCRNAADTGEAAAAKSKTKITDDSLLKEKTVENSKGAVDSLVTSLNGCANPATITAFQKISTNIELYINSRKSCTGMAEKAEFLCVESPGAKNAKMIMDLAGPALAVINSTQKVCSGSAQVTDVASKILMLAKGACVAAKVLCDSTCTGASKKLELIGNEMVSLSQNAQAEVTGIVAAAKLRANNLMAPDPAAAAQVAKCEPVIQQVSQTGEFVADVASKEKQATSEGSTANLVARCEKKMDEILGFGVNIASTMIARDKARECARQTAVDGVGGEAVTLAAYCDQQANAQTEVCQCQKNPQKEGCAGAIATFNPDNTELESDLAGTNIRNGAGLSNFAGAGVPKGNSNIDLSGSGSNGSGSDGAANLLKTTSTGGGAPVAVMGSSGDGGGGYGSGSSGAGADADKLKKDEQDKNKLSFGGAVSGVQSLGSGRAGAGNGALTNQQKEAAQRKLASDQRNREISTASGKSNWEKVRERYIMQTSSFLVGQ